MRIAHVQMYMQYIHHLRLVLTWVSITTKPAIYFGKVRGSGWRNNNLSLFGYFVVGGSPTLFGLGRGPITPPDPAMVRTGRKDLNSNKTKNKSWGNEGRTRFPRAYLEVYHIPQLFPKMLIAAPLSCGTFLGK